MAPRADWALPPVLNLVEMDRMQDWVIEKNVFLISASPLVTLGLRTLLDTRLGNVRVTGSASDYPPHDTLSLSNADMIVFDCSDTDDLQRIGDISAELQQTFGKPVLLLADSARLEAMRSHGHRIVDRVAPSDELLEAIEDCLHERPPEVATVEGADDVRRRAVRVPVRIPVRVDTATCMTRNVSAQGMYIELREAAQEVGESVLIEIDLHSPDGDSTLTLSGEIVRKEIDGQRIGLGVRILSSGGDALN